MKIPQPDFPHYRMTNYERTALVLRIKNRMRHAEDAEDYNRLWCALERVNSPVKFTAQVKCSSPTKLVA